MNETQHGGGAPARIARGGLALPEVKMPADQEPPYVVCSRHPTGEIALATVGRKQGSSVVIPRATVSLEVGALDRPVGIFGEYASLTLITTSTLGGRRILAQDLAGSTPVDITSEVTVAGGRLTLPGAVIHRVGLMAATPGDTSDPGLVLVIEGLATFVPKPAMTPARPPARPVVTVEPGARLTVARATWGPVYGGTDITPRIAAPARDGALVVDAKVENLGATGIPDRYNRLELVYNRLGRATTVPAVAGERVIIDSQGNYRTERAPRPPVKAPAIPKP